jgi:hypothetical protein
MATATFDSLTREFSSSMTRRSALRSLFAGAVVAVAGGAVLTHEAEGKRRRKKSRKSQHQSSKLQPGQRCQVTSQCVSGYICEVPVNGSNSDTYCSGGQGAVCGAPNGDGDDTFPFCAVGFACQPSGTTFRCQAVPEDL